MTFDDEDQRYELREPALKVLESIKWYISGTVIPTKHSSTWIPWRWT
jgi:hypothetical protein